MRKTAAASLRDPSKTQRPHRRGGGGRGIEKVREARFGWKTEWQLLRRGLSHLLKRTSPPLSAAEPWFAAPTPVNVQPRRAARIAGASLVLVCFRLWLHLDATGSGICPPCAWTAAATAGEQSASSSPES